MTPQQLAAYDYVRDILTECGTAPSIQEIADQLGLHSKAPAHAIVEALIKMGRLRRTAARTHNLALPEDIAVDLSIVGTGTLQAELERRGHRFTRPRSVNIAETTPCAADGCGERVARGKMLCGDHWFSLPYGLRRELIETHRNRQERNFQNAWGRALDHLRLAKAG